MILDGIISSDFAAAHCSLWQMWPKYVKWISVWFISFIILDSFLHPGRGVMLYTIYCHSSEKRGLRSTFCSDETLQNLPYLLKKKTHIVFVLFFISSNFEIYLMNALVYVDKNNTWVFFFHKYSKFWSISLGHKFECRPLFSEECTISADGYPTHIYRTSQESLKNGIYFFFSTFFSS